MHNCTISGAYVSVIDGTAHTFEADVDPVLALDVFDNVCQDPNILTCVLTRRGVEIASLYKRNTRSHA